METVALALSCLVVVVAVLLAAMTADE